MSQAEDIESVDEDGVIESVSGPVVTATDLDARMNDVVYVGDEGLMGEVIEIEGNLTTIQVYEETSGVGPGEPVQNTGEPLSVDLGPGMLDSIYDGVQRPLDVLEEKMGTAFLDRGVDAPGSTSRRSGSSPRSRNGRYRRTRRRRRGRRRDRHDRPQGHGAPGLRGRRSDHRR